MSIPANLEEHRRLAIKVARCWMNSDPVYLDTETTGLGPKDEVCEIAILDSALRRMQFFPDHGLVRPSIQIPAEATAIHGIRDIAVQDAETFDILWSRIKELLAGRTVIIYNALYDLRMMRQSLNPYHEPFPGLPRWAWPSWKCAMNLYAEFNGDWNEEYQSFRWISLEKAVSTNGMDPKEILGTSKIHRAAGDVRLTRALVEKIARS